MPRIPNFTWQDLFFFTFGKISLLVIIEKNNNDIDTKVFTISFIIVELTTFY